jgi:murein DD-endopeptidase MepM/ murein hydrolase activator NlpD
MPTHTRIRIAAALVITVAAALVVASSSPAAHTASAAYGWPVKPFDRPHPVRGGFGDPRTVFAGPPTQRTLMSGNGSFQFHNGVDISAPDGTAVYPVEPGTVETVMHEWIGVTGADGRSFRYWHITPTVHLGQHVETDVTVLGRIIKGCGHVHLSEFDGGIAVNPLAAGHLSPYSDNTKPVVDSISFRNNSTGDALMPEIVAGRVEVVAGAHDLPNLPVPGAWHGLPIAPALLTWRVQKADTGKVVVPTRVAFDFRAELPANPDLWSVYARGSQQNMSVFGKHYSYMQPGKYLFRLTPNGFDTHTLRNAVYDLVVTVADIRGNQSTSSLRFTVANAL